MANSAAPSRTLPTRTARKCLHYQEPDTESDTETESFIRPVSARLSRPPRRAQIAKNIAVKPLSSRPVRAGRRVETYREDSDSDGNPIPISPQFRTEIDVQSTKQVRSIIRPRTRSTSSLPKPSNNSKNGPKSCTAFNSHKRRKLGHPRSINKLTKSSQFEWRLPDNGIIPPWQTLPYVLLVKILKYAAFPLYSNNGVRNSSIQWLVNTSKLCKSFNDAATTALFHCPPLLPAEHARELVRLLNSDPDTLALNYKHRVHALHVEARELLVRKSGLRLEQLLQCSPLLTELRIFHVHDKWIGKALWADPAYTREKWSYGDTFTILDRQKIKLTVFEWNGRFQDTVSSMIEAHGMSCMQDLEDVTIVNLAFDERREPERIAARDALIKALSLLHRLSSLTFRNCNILDDVAMTQLPQGLTCLSIVCCQSLTSDGLHLYLSRGAQSLSNLQLAGNQVMSLGFMSTLKDMCPSLEQLHLDLNYDDCTSYNDREPLYDELLPNGSPTWPTKLRSIVVGPLRLLSINDAEGFFASLINSAEDLKSLRTLSVKTLLTDAGWRDRARLRSRWAPLFDKVFLSRKHSSPQPNKVSTIDIPENAPISRKSARLVELEGLSPSSSTDDLEDPPMLSGTICSRQNLCNTVEFELSDQRPAKDQYTEQDFLDEELGGDGTYNG